MAMSARKVESKSMALAKRQRAAETISFVQSQNNKNTTETSSAVCRAHREENSLSTLTSVSPWIELCVRDWGQVLH